MINKKTLLFGNKETTLKIEISYEWNDNNDELVNKIIEKLPKFIDKQIKGLRKL